MPIGIYKHPPQCGFQKGNKIWLGRKHTEESIKKTREAKKGNKNALGKHWEINEIFKGKNHWRWNENVGYQGLHQWIRRALKRPKKCSMCGVKGKKNGRSWSIHWANKSGKYLRDKTDWLPLCPRCHKKYERTHH